MTFHQLISILAARWRLMATVFLLIVGVAAAALLLLPKQYTATSSVMLDVASPDPVAAGNLASMLQPGYMATQVDLVSSDRVARRAIRSLGLLQNAELQALWQAKTQGVGEFEAWLAERVQKKLDVSLARESNVINISYSSDNGRNAADTANAIMKAYIDTTVEMRVEPARESNRFYDERAKQLRQELETAQARLSAYQRENGLIATDERLDVENARLAELSSQLVALQGAAAESSGRRAQANARPDQIQEVLGDPVVVSLNTDLSREQAKLGDLSARLGDNHPQVAQQQATIAELKTRLAAAVQRASGSVRVTASVNQGRLQQAESALEAQRAKVLRLKGMRDEAAVLQRDVENAQRAYDAMQTRVNQTNVESQSTLTNVGVLKRASQPPEASSPKPLLIGAAALVGGLFLGVVAALLRELFDRRLRTDEDVLLELKQRVLVTLPASRHQLAGPSAPQAQRIQARVLHGLAGPKADNKT